MPATATLADRLLSTRSHSEALCQPLQTEDYVVQPIEDVSPPKWHLGHTTWFFEEFVLKTYAKGYKAYHRDFAFVFNSYYESLGKRVVRAHRGNLSRPPVQEVYRYRRHVTEQLMDLLEGNVPGEALQLVEVGIHHEQQHQELLLTDIKYILGNNPLLPAYSPGGPREYVPRPRADWIPVPGGIHEIGHRGEGFCFDNELGVHQVLLGDFEISSQPVTNGDMLDFIADDGYGRFELWHAEGWDWVNRAGIGSPLYWHQQDGHWLYYTLQGLQQVEPDAPLAHLSYYEAYALAQWKGCRLPTEFEWEAAQQRFDWGQRWEWTGSAYLPYPGYQKAPGALGEYNGKFMVGQHVLRGASIATPHGHSRHTYRNFFHPPHRWQYTGLRLAR
ncbi:ergothioneine biosynthesis protein EgtB [Robiginitalea sp. SC105]|uniref:ergothioneine biosynthesis protein EgtB n=1 Tax=Robiginitalea sp. SC105 TaxID=2762332 RepID=UPI0016397B89|nr:ergothioneine biosynthesis protein EgtB [Robiginitalea sp. SC105]MBC2838915.1 ergothioneine biosynthesis protein EgtB [Robiginitalea sp. SC105]